ncbi:MAG: AbrB/MazE/SpoVT family DNA-binding domain-containing protein [Candidatus Liptonbacteria bacterium]|nr:AbrB/MazE/SpoVT family DNA-binding domain-containing protein [Candidatus Liptonbacteria bacterium]
MNKKQSGKNFYGTTNVGSKGQVVIPVAARKNMKLKKGDRLLVFGMHEDMVAMIKLSQVEKIASHLSEKLKMIDEVIRKNK